MKKILIVLLHLFCILSAHAAADTMKTKIEQAINTKGSLIKQEVFSLENIAAFRLDPIKITNLEQFSITSGLKVVYKAQVGKELRTLNNYIDIEEIDGILTTLDYMKTILRSKVTPGSYSEIKYITKSGFELLLFTVLNDKNKLDWNFSIQPNIEKEGVFLELQQEDIARLKKLFLQAKEKL